MSKINTKNIIKILALGFIVVLCPAASWYYLQKGLDYQKDARKEIVVRQDLDVSPFISEHIKNDSTLIENRLRVLLFDEKLTESPARKELKAKLIDQFESSNGVFIIEFIKGTLGSESSELLSDMHVRKVLNGADYDSLLSQDIGQPSYKNVGDRLILDKLVMDKPITDESHAMAVLIDHQNGLRNLYDTNDPERIKRMVEHMAILIPRVDREKAELIREKEM